MMWKKLLFLIPVIAVSNARADFQMGFPRGSGGDNLGNQIASGTLITKGQIAIATTVPQAQLTITSGANVNTPLIVVSTNDTKSLLYMDYSSFTVNSGSTVFSGVTTTSQTFMRFGSSLFGSSGAILGATGGSGGIFAGPNKQAGIQGNGSGVLFLISGGNALLDGSNGVVHPVQVIQGQDGTESAPAFSYNQATSNGLYRISGQGQGISIGGVESLRIGVASATVKGNVVLSSNTSSIGISTSPTCKLDILNGSVTVRNQAGSNTGIGGGISASTYTINGTGIFVSSWNAREYDGYSIYHGSDTLTGNTSKRIIGAGLTSFIGLGCFEVENVNTAGISVRMKAQTITDRFDCYNADAINSKDFSWLALGKP